MSRFPDALSILPRLPDALLSNAEEVSADGSVVVGRSGSASGTEAFRWTSGGGMVGLGDLTGGGFNSRAYDVSGDGTVVVGVSNFASGSEAFRWTSGGGMVGLGDLAGGSFSSIAQAVSADGAVVVGGSISASGYEAYRWTSGGGMVGLGALPAEFFWSAAAAVSGDGSVVVGSSESASGEEAVIWDSANGMQSVSSVLISSGVDMTGWTLVEASGISDDGLTIVGWGTNPSGSTEAWLVTLDSPIMAIAVDIKPKHCPNKLKIKNDDDSSSDDGSSGGKKGNLKVAILGTQEFDVTTIDIATVSINGVAPVKSKIKDVTAPSALEPCDCEKLPKDTYEDLELKFNRQDIIASLGTVQDGDEIELTLTGNLLDGTAIEGIDCVLVEDKGDDDDSGSGHKKKKKRKHHGSDDDSSSDDKSSDDDGKSHDHGGGGDGTDPVPCPPNCQL